MTIFSDDDRIYNSELFVTGHGHFVDDIKLPGMMFMSVVRSPYARAKILRIKGGLNSSEFSRRMASVGEGATPGASYAVQPVFATEYVNYVGEPVAAVFADDRYKAEDMLESVDVEYDVLKPVVTIEQALSSEPIHPGMKSNVIASGSLGADFKEPDGIVLEDVLVNERIATNPIEPRGVVADFNGSNLNVYISTQSVYSIKSGLSQVLGLSMDRIRVMQMDTGGAFGSKGGLYPEYVIASYASMKYKRPVKWIETRREHLSSTNQGRGATGRMKIFSDRNGRIKGLKGEIIVDSGAYGSGIGIFASRYISSMVTGPYLIENAFINYKTVLTNKVPLGPYRGAGRPEAAFFIERMIDLLADELSMDPAEIRLLNATEKPFVSPVGLEIDASKPFIERALKSLKYKEITRKNRNFGLSFFVLVPAVFPGETARVLVKDGRVNVWLGGNSHGQGHENWVKTIVNEELDVPENIVFLFRGDTGMIKEGIGTWGSRSAIVGGAALVSACRKIKQDVIKKYGRYTPSLLLSGEWDCYVKEERRRQLNSFGANLVTVDVDEFGAVKINDCKAYYDVGRALNRDMVIGQIRGGMAQGIGQVLHETIRYNEDGQLLTSSISDAGVPTAEQLPDFDVLYEENRSDEPHGAKGLGESPTIGVPPALIRAIEVASGKRLRKTPVMPEEIIP
ncbi:MAG: xanthine dehydrogenase family protein molybdopterin-binding subunit [Thermoplasmatales archaeon]